MGFKLVALSLLILVLAGISGCHSSNDVVPSGANAPKNPEAAQTPKLQLNPNGSPTPVGAKSKG